MKSIAMAAFAATLSLASISGATAKEYTVDYNELALRDIVGTRSVYRDILADAKRVCGAEGYALRNGMSTAECVDHVVEQSVREIGDRALTNIHNQRS
ncbi:UrcA family protein [Aquisalinus flavus]|nr:UrcA family protein [Aquisalinus flavus]MBD0426147.1 UrcA family protein [Aquisalinus flavus]